MSDQSIRLGDILINTDGTKVGIAIPFPVNGYAAREFTGEVDDAPTPDMVGDENEMLHVFIPKWLGDRVRSYATLSRCSVRAVVETALRNHLATAPKDDPTEPA